MAAATASLRAVSSEPRPSWSGGLRRSVTRRIDRRVEARVDARLAREFGLAARFLPVDPTSDIVVTPRATPTAAGSPEEFPLPPEDLWERAFDYLELGSTHASRLRAAVARAGGGVNGHLLDFGCGSGRVIRWFLDEARDHEVWGVDFNAEHIAWAQQHLSPPFRFALGTSLPHLPFEDDTFAVVFAGSVFTHISELGDAWLLELRRVTRPGGVLYLTVHDEVFVERLISESPNSWLGQFMLEHASTLEELGRTADIICIGRGSNDSQVFHARDALVQRWSQHLEVVEVLDEDFYHQSAVVLRKRER